MANQESLPLDWAKARRTNEYIYVRKELRTQVTSEWFEPSFWQQNNAVVGQSKGRNITYFVRHDCAGNSLNMVLRHYYRGGAVRHLSRDKFIYTGVKKTRCFKELQMLADMAEKGLPVPRPIAARVTKTTPWTCTKDILIETIEGAKDGFHWLLSKPFDEQVWQRVGETIAQFHRHGVFHSDLNIHNILVDEKDQVYLIDFDNCEFRPLNKKWQMENLARLKRSLLKERGLHQTFNFEECNWQMLMVGYRK